MTIALADTQYRCSVVIQLGTTSTVVGFSNMEQPKFIIPTNYYRNDSSAEDKYTYGLYEILDELDSAETRGNIFSIINSEYTKVDFDRLLGFLQYIYTDKLGLSSHELPLVVTLPYDAMYVNETGAGTFSDDINKTSDQTNQGSNNSQRSHKIVSKYDKTPKYTPFYNKLKNLLLDNMQIPVINILNEPLSTSLSLGRVNSLVVDCGGNRCNVSGIIDGHVISSFSSKIAGNYLDFKIMEKINEKLQKMNINNSISDNNSVQQWKNSWLWLKDFKSLLLNCDPQVSAGIATTSGGYNDYSTNANGIINTEEEEQEEEEEENTVNFLLKEQGGITLQFTESELKQLSDCMFDPVLTTSSSSSSSSSPNNDGDNNTTNNNTSNTTNNNTNNTTNNNTNNNTSNNNNNANTNQQYFGVGKLIVACIKQCVSEALDELSNTGPNNTANNNHTNTNSNNSNISKNNNNNNNNNNNGLQEYTIIESLLNNVLITGGSTLIPGFENRILYEISNNFPKFKISTFANPILQDRLLSNYHAGVAMSNLSWELNDWKC